MELLDALALQVEWGADEALLPGPQDRRRAPPPVTAFALPGATPESPVDSLAETPRPATRRPRPAAFAPAGPEDAARLAATCTSLDELAAAMRDFTGCALRDTATQLVFADGAADARLILVGEAPGAEEDRLGRPFVGPAGQLLDKMLASIGLDRNQVRIINAVPWRPPGNRTPTETELALCLPFLHRQIALIAPYGLFTLGAVAARALLGPAAQTGIRRLRGRWQEAAIEGLPAPLPCLPSYHPAYLLRTPLAKREAWADLLTLRAWLAAQNR